ncbi:drebrin-like isoform X5 [Scleropages formosus]|uniref:drebrin-like isoform X5 n=1 Tax=Scleropages formosus TaxID=113540 RepID=UPI0010FA7955|nr:drebrin-like isoform X5 [Scleropages formosus]
MRAVNLDTYSLSLLTAKEDIVNPRCSTNWALFRYDGITNNLRLSDSGVGGLVELVQKFHPNRAYYGLCQVGTDGPGHPHVVLIAWVGEGVDEYSRIEYASHLPAIKEFFKEAHIYVSAKTLDDVTEERINAKFSKTDTSASNAKLVSRFVEKTESVGTNYRRTIAAMEMRRINRDSFWARSERDEEKRKEEERRRAAEERRRWEWERIQQELREAEERERKMEEKEQMLQEQRRLQAKMEAEARKQEILRWEQQQREQEEDMRTGLTQSQYVDQAAEAAALVSQRSANPREFFRQLSSSSTAQPASTHPGRPPFRHYSHSLTESAFIFGRAADPQSPTLDPGITPASSQVQDVRDTSLQCIIAPASPPASTLPPSRSFPVSVPQLEQFPPLHGAGDLELLSPSQSATTGPDPAYLCARHFENPSSSEDAPSAEEDTLAPPGSPDITQPLHAVCPEDPVATQMGSEVDVDSVLKEQPTFVYSSALPLTDCSTPQVMDTDPNIILVAKGKDHDKQEQDGTSVVHVKACDDNQIPARRTETGKPSVQEHVVMEETPVAISDPCHGSDTEGTILDNLDQPTAQVPTLESKIWIMDDLKSEAENRLLVDNNGAEQIYESMKDGQHSNLMSSTTKTDETREDFLLEEHKGVRAKDGEECVNNKNGQRFDADHPTGDAVSEDLTEHQPCGGKALVVQQSEDGHQQTYPASYVESLPQEVVAQPWAEREK